MTEIQVTMGEVGARSRCRGRFRPESSECYVKIDSGGSKESALKIRQAWRGHRRKGRRGVIRWVSEQ